MNKYESVLSLKKYVVNNIRFDYNEKFDNKEKVSISFSIQKEITYVENEMSVKLKTIIFENAKENNFPFEMEVEILGIFEIQGDKKINWEPNAIAILYPYIRSIVSTYTSVANVFPIILPVINVNAMLKEKNEES